MSTLKKLKQELRFRIGEPQEGTFTSATAYETNTGVSDNLDELKLVIEAAEEKVVEDLIQNEKPLLVGAQQIAIESGVYGYALPTDFIKMVILQHESQGVFYTLLPARISLLFDDFDPALKTTRMSHYDIQGVTAAILAQGVATGGSHTQLTDTDANSFGNPTDDVDIVRNLRDKSLATITGSTATTVTASAGLSGGRSNTFRAGDRYQIESAEETAQVLWIYPPIVGGDVQQHVANTGAKTTTQTIDNATSPSASFTTTDPIVLYSVKIDIATLSTEIQPIRIRIETNSGGSPSGTLASTNPESVAAVDVPFVGEIEAIFESGIELADGTYHIVASTIETASYAWNSSATGGKYRIYGYTGDEFLQMHYARYPRKFSSGTTGDAETSEIPLFAKEATLLWAEHLCYRKTRGIRGADTLEARRLYEFEIEKVLQRLNNQNVTEFDVVRNVLPLDVARGVQHSIFLKFPVNQ